MPTPQEIHDFYVSGKWDLMMLRAALVCHQITQDQYGQTIKDREDAKKKKTSKSKK